MSFAAASLRMASGGIVWALHFAAVYGFTGLACARDLAPAVPWAVATASVAAVAACLLILAGALKRGESFEAWLSGGLAGVALVAVIWETVPALLVPPCV